MVCPRCKSERVNVQMVTETQLKNKRKGAVWWCLVGWWWVPIKWLFLFIPAIIIKIFAPKKQKLEVTHKTLCVCQNCGYSWDPNLQPAPQNVI